jgi:hypothetical protein
VESLIQTTNEQKPKVEEIQFRLTVKQSEFALSDARHPAFIAAWGTGKTFAGIARALMLSQRYDNNLGVIFRKEFTDLRDSTVKDFEEYSHLKVNSGRDVKFENGSTIMFRHLEEMNNIQNINLGWFWIEQAEELDSDDQFFKLWGRLRRANVAHSGFLTANTNGHNWIYKHWKLGTLNGAQLFEATTFDNQQNLSPDFIKSMDILREEKPMLYRRFVLNSWEDGDTYDTVIPFDWVTSAMSRESAQVGDVVIGVDVARFGDDSTVLFPIKGRRALPYVKMHGNDTMSVVGKIVEMADELKAKAIYVDTIGIGAGVFDRLKELEYPVFSVNVAESSTVIHAKTGKPKYKNLRSQLWFMARESIDTRPEFNKAPFSLMKDEDFSNELTTPKYTINSAGQIEVEAKDDMKKRLGRSPDIADAYCLAIYGIMSNNFRPSAALSGSTLRQSLATADWM